jgi:hypothetical protein
MATMQWWTAWRYWTAACSRSAARRSRSANGTRTLSGVTPCWRRPGRGRPDRTERGLVGPSRTGGVHQRQGRAGLSDRTEALMHWSSIMGFEPFKRTRRGPHRAVDADHRRRRRGAHRRTLFRSDVSGPLLRRSAFHLPIRSAAARDGAARAGAQLRHLDRYTVRASRHAGLKPPPPLWCSKSMGHVPSRQPAARALRQKSMS